VGNVLDHASGVVTARDGGETPPSQPAGRQRSGGPPLLMDR